MKTNELLKEIEEDKILQELTETLIKATKNAQSIIPKIEKREVELWKKLENYGGYIVPIYTHDIDKLESSIDATESKSTIERKLVALREAKRIPWTENSEYREAMHQYFTYLIPILTDIETAKDESRKTIAEINTRYKRELQGATDELNLYKNKIEEFFRIAGEISQWSHQEYYVRNMFGGIARADDFAIHKAKIYKSKEIIGSDPKIE